MKYLQQNEYSPGYNVIDFNQLPFIFFGFNIKSEIDKDITINKDYKPFYFKHYSRINADIYKDQYYYGIRLSDINNFQDLIKKLNKISYNDDILTLEAYKNLIKQYGLSCDDCYRDFYIGSYPIDLKYLPLFTKIYDKLTDDFQFNDGKINLAGLHLKIITSMPKFDSTFNFVTLNNF